MQTNQYDLAINSLNMAIQINPYDAQIYAMRGALQKKLGDEKGSSDDYKQVDKLTSQISSTSGINYRNIVIGQAEYSVGNIQQGAKLISQEFGRFGRFGGERISAIIPKLIEDVFRQPEIFRNPDNYANLLGSMSIYMNNNVAVDQSTADIMKASSYVVYASNMPISNENLTTMFNLVDQAINSNKNNKLIYIAYAIRSAFREDAQSEKEDFDQALKVAPLTFEAYSYRGMTYLALKNKKRALADLQTASQMALEKKDDGNYRFIMTIIDHIQDLSNQ